MFLYSVEVVLRAEAVEMAQAGDKCDFTGTLIVVPDVAALSMASKLYVIYTKSRYLDVVGYHFHWLIENYHILYASFCIIK